jgi:thiol peroxidase
MMTKVKMKEKEISLVGSLPSVGSKAIDFNLTTKDLKDVSLEKYKGKRLILNCFPSLDTHVCQLTIKEFQKRYAQDKDTQILNISMDLPFAASRFCESLKGESIETLSAFRSSFPKDYGILIGEGAIKGLLARAVFVIEPDGVISYVELVPDISSEPTYRLKND